MPNPIETYKSFLEEFNTKLTALDFDGAELALMKANATLLQLPLESQGGGQNGNSAKRTLGEEVKSLMEQLNATRIRYASKSTPIMTQVPTYYANPRGISNDWRT